MRSVGIDLGATRFHVAVIDRGVELFSTRVLGDVVAACHDADAIAVDAPSEPATGRLHDGQLSRKFAVARCNEIAAGQQLGVWVPWVTPTIDAAPAWMRTGFELWDALRANGHRPLEVYPAGCFWLRNGRSWPAKKTTPAGRSARRSLLDVAVDVDSHDLIDAAMCASVARNPSACARHSDPGCDGSSIWF